jgi:glycosyltransferase involved in cell wall biosynthesis
VTTAPNAAAPTVVMGLPLYNRVDYLPEALDSLLAQTYRDFALVLVDDRSSDRTEEVARRYAARDRRIVYYQNKARLGMIGNWRRCFELARELYPGSRYFAWGSDHDVWDPRWMACLVAELEHHPEVVLAYPLNLRISETGEPIKGPFTFDTFGVPSGLGRLRVALDGMSAGNMVYGLMRADAMARAGVFRHVMVPDRLLLAELSLYGQFKQVPEVLWRRRFGGLYSAQRQRAAFFPDGAPLYSYLPWSIEHSASLAWQLGAHGVGEPTIGRLAGLKIALAYLLLGTRVEIHREWRRTWYPRARRLNRERRERVHRTRKNVRRQIRRLHPRRVVNRVRRFLWESPATETSGSGT